MVDFFIMQKRLLSREISWVGRKTGKLGKIIGSKIHRRKKHSDWGKTKQNQTIKKTPALVFFNFFFFFTKPRNLCQGTQENQKMMQWMHTQGKPQILQTILNAQTTEGHGIDTTVCSDKPNCRRKTAYGYSQNTESIQWQYAL